MQPSDEDTWDDYDDEARYERPRAWERKDRFSPTPPSGWLITITGFDKSDTREIGCWLFALKSLQFLSVENGMKVYRIVRHVSGDRAILAHPALNTEIIGILNDIHMGLNCSCGGECLEGQMQAAATRVAAARRWRDSTDAERIEILQSADEEGVDFDAMSEYLKRKDTQWLRDAPGDVHWQIAREW